MSNSYFTNPIIFLISTLFELYLCIIIIRFLLQWVRADFYNPISQFILKITNPALIPLRRIVPSIAGIDLAALVLLSVLATIELFLVYLLTNYHVSPPALALNSVAKVIELFLGVYFFTMIVQVILSWVAPSQYNPVTALLHQINEPLLRPIRRILPPMGGFDLSTLVALILIQVTKMIVLPPFFILN